LFEKNKYIGHTFTILVIPESKQHSNTYNRYREIQKNQLTELKHYIDDNNITNYILMGDFNINKDANDSLFNYMLNLFNYNDKIQLLPSTATFPKTNEILDYIFINDKNVKKMNKTRTLSKRTHKILSSLGSNKMSFISDHNPIHLL